MKTLSVCSQYHISLHSPIKPLHTYFKVMCVAVYKRKVTFPYKNPLNLKYYRILFSNILC